MSEATIDIEPGFTRVFHDTTHVLVMRHAAELVQDLGPDVKLKIVVDGLVQMDRVVDFDLVWPAPAFVSRTLDKYRKRTSARLTHSELIQPVIDEWVEIGKLMVAVLDDERRALAQTGVAALLKAIPQLGLDESARETAYHTVALVAWMATQKDIAVTDPRTHTINLFVSLLSELIRP